MPSVTDQGIVGYMCDSDNTYPYSMSVMRIITGSCSDMASNFYAGAGRDDAWLIHPGYKVSLYGSNGNLRHDLDNTTGLYVKMYYMDIHRNLTHSFKAFYKTNTTALPDMGGTATDIQLYEVVT